MHEPAIASEKLRIERKQFFFDLKENPRGQFLKITEDVKGRRDTIIIPVTGLVDFREALDRLITTVEMEEEYQPLDLEEGNVDAEDEDEYACDDD